MKEKLSSRVLSVLVREKYLVLVYLLLITIFFRWFVPGHFFNGDTGFLNVYSLKHIELLSFWKGYDNLGGQTVDYPFMLINTIGALPTRLFGLEYNDHTIKLLFFYPYILLAPLGMYQLSVYLTNNRFASSISSLLYSLSTPIITSLAMGHINLVIPFAIFPLIFLHTLKYFKSKNFLQVLIIISLFILVSIYEFRLFYLSFMWFSFMLLYLGMLDKQFRALGTLWVGVLISTLFANLYWILPSLSSSNNLYSNPILQRSVFGSEFMSYAHAITAFHPFWSTQGVQIFTKQPIPFVFLSSPFFAVATLLMVKGKKDRSMILFLLLLLLIGVLLAKQYNAPFSFIYSTVFNYIPGFKVFRESTKFFQIIVFTYSLLMSYFLDHISRYKNKILLWTALLLIVCNITVVSFPIMTGKMGSIFNKKDITDHNYQALNEFLIASNLNTYFRLLWVPTGPSLSIIKDSMPHLHYTFLEQILAQDVTANNNKVLGSQLLRSSELKGILRAYSVKFIIVPSESSSADTNFFYWYEPRTNYINELDKISFLKKIPNGNSSISIYENTDYMPHVSFATNLINPNRKSDYVVVKYERNSPSEYRVQLSNLDKVGYLHFAENYHLDWKVKIGDFRWYETIYDTNPNIMDEFHIKDLFGTNSFRVDPEYIKQNIDPSHYKVNANGSLDLDLTLYFRPQSYLYLGLVMSLSTIIIILMSTIILLHLRKYRNR